MSEPEYTTTNNDELAQSSSYVPRGPVVAKLNFYNPPADGAKPFSYLDEPPEGTPKRNFRDTDIAVNITDIRGQESAYNIDENAFSTLKVGLSVAVDFSSEESIKERYFPEVEQILLEHVPGAKRVYIINYTVRPSGGKRPPVLRVHIDQSKAAAEERVKHFLPDEAETLLRGRFRLINVWRVLNGPVQCSPLAFADSRTVSDESLVAAELRYPDRIGENLFVKHANEQWYYWSGVENDERLLLQIFDNEKGGRLPHTAFVDSRSPAGGRQRESIEVRALVFG